MTQIDDLVIEAHLNSLKHGFWDDCPVWDTVRAGESVELATYYGNKLMLIVGEVAEAHEELRKNADASHVYFRNSDEKPEGLGYELADVIIRVFDLAGAAGIPLAEYIDTKMAFNADRPAMHGKNF